jgi:hypothetical protein
MSCWTVDYIVASVSDTKYKRGQRGNSAYINTISQRTRRIFMSKYHQKPRHSLQAAYSRSINSVLHTRNCDGGADKEAFSVFIKRRSVQRCHCVVSAGVT